MQSKVKFVTSSFPSFAVAWKDYLARWEGESVGAYIDISEFAHFIDKELLAGGQLEEARRAFLLLDQLFLQGDEPTRDLIGLGLVEDLQNTLSWRTGADSAVIPLLPPTLLRVWRQIEKQWAGHSNLMEVIRAEKAESKSPHHRQQESGSSWAELLDLPRT